ncbi:MAG: hypothetical protein JO191_03035 [Mycobacteriaceae bacterium]|nr:hypothetical protein [Mycobacteriaceae bacterium]
MVEVDVFWAYGLGAGFATAATHQIAHSKDHPSGAAERGWQRYFSSPYFTVAVLYCALLFAPSGAYLLWAFPDWETMQVARDHASLAAWLVTLFAITNVSQGIAGYWVTAKLIRAGHRYAAFLQVALGYFGMLLILVHGWDGRGYQRFFSANRAVFASWPRDPTVGDAVARAGRWVTSPVALTLAGMSVIVVVLLWIMSAWLKEGYRLAGTTEAPGAGTVVSAVLGLVFIGALGSAIVTSVLIHLLGWWIGGPVAAVVVWLVAVRPRIGLAYRFFERLHLTDANVDLPVPVGAGGIG